MPKQQTILLVEDDGFLVQMYASKLEMEGFKVLAAVDGEKALRIIKKEHPDLILLDILLPKKDGFQVLKELKQDESVKDIPVVVLSNLGQREDIEKCFSLGAVDYLIKAHFIPSEVIAKLKAHLENY